MAGWEDFNGMWSQISKMYSANAHVLFLDEIAIFTIKQAVQSISFRNCPGTPPAPPRLIHMPGPPPPPVEAEMRTSGVSYCLLKIILELGNKKF